MPFRRQEPEPLPPLYPEPEDLLLTKEGELKAWRLLSLIEAFIKRFNEPPTLDDIDLLGRVASSRADLHDACDALVGGCSVVHLVAIFT